MLFHIAPLALALPLAQGIQLREPTPLAPSTQWWAANQLVQEADRFVFTWVQPAGSLLATWSDGRALEWTAATPVPLAPPGAALLNYHSTLVGDRLVVCWNDNRNHIGASSGTPQWGAFVRTVSLPDGQVGPDLPLPAFGFPTQTETRVQAVASALVGGQRHVHLLMSARTWQPADYELRLVSSHDGGATFPHVLDLDLESESFVPLALVAEGPAVHAAIGSRHFRSLDGGISLDPTAAPLLSLEDGTTFAKIVLHRSADKLTAAWTRSEWQPSTSTFVQLLEAAVSEDGGSSFPLPELLDTETATFIGLRVQQALSVPAAGTAVVGWTRDNLSFPIGTVFTAVKEGQGSWTETNLAGDSVFGLRWVGLAGDPRNRKRVAACWAGVDSSFFPSFSSSSLRISRDGGQSFEPTQAATNDGSIALGIGYSSTYQNAAIVSHDGAGWLAGGGRLQSLQPTGFVAGPTQLGAQFEGFDDGSQTAWMLAALGPGYLPWIDGRNLGLSIDFLLADSIGLAASGVFAAPLGATGSGQLTPIALSIPFGVSVSFVGLSIDLLTFEVRDISDVVSVTAQ